MGWRWVACEWKRACFFLLEWVCGEVTEEGGIVTGSCGFSREDFSGEKGGGKEEKLFLRWLGRSVGRSAGRARARARARARSSRKKSSREQRRSRSTHN